MRLPASRKFGFSLVEVLIVVAIFGLIFLVGSASYRSFSRRQLLESGVRQVRADLNLARECALSGKKPDTIGCNAFPLEAVEFLRTGVAANGCTGSFRNSYLIRADCSGGGYADIKTANLPTGICLQNFVTIEFRSNAYYTPHGTGVTVSVQDAVTGQLINIDIDESGNIR